MKFLKVGILILLLTNQCYSQKPEESPFGVCDSRVLSGEHLIYALDAGIKWVRIAGSSAMIWNQIEADSGTYNWTTTGKYKIALNADANGFNILWTTKSYNSWDQELPEGGGAPGLPTDLQAYADFIGAAAERYDGDENDDAPGNQIIRYWQIENKVDGNFWGGTATEYAEVLKVSYEAIKSTNPNAQVVMAGAGTVEPFYNNNFYVQILDALENLGGRHFDIIDVHWYGAVGEYNGIKVGKDNTYYSLSDFMIDLRNLLDSYGYGEIDIWITETGTYSGDNVLNAKNEVLPAQTEADQAAELLKRYVYFLSQGISHVFWYSIKEVWSQGGWNGLFSNVGIINNPDADGVSYKKLAFHTYKSLVKMLEGSDWDTMQTIREADNVYVYKFANVETGEPVYVAWWDWFNEPTYSEGDKKSVELTVGDMYSVRITDAVPDADGGDELDENDYPAFFAVTTKPVTNGAATILLGKNPVYIEPIYLPTSVGEELTRQAVLEQNYPNPFNSSTTISYNLLQSSYVVLHILYTQGQKVRVLVDESQPVGSHSVVWDRKDSFGKAVADGIYISQLNTIDNTQTKNFN